MKKILGISAFYHDSAAAICVGGEAVAAAQEERFSRIKHDAGFPIKAIEYCLEEAGLELDELDAVVFYDKPFLKFERLLETYYAFAPRGLVSFLKAIPVWLHEKLFLKKRILDGLKEVGNYDRSALKLLFIEHHLSHAASAFYPSPYESAAILTIDGVGEWATASIGLGKGKAITIKKELHFPHSVGLLYSAFTYYLGFKVNSGEYKLMGLAPFGNRESETTERFIKIIKDSIVDIKDDGSIWLNQHFFNYATGLRMVKNDRWATLFGFPRRKPDDEILQQHCDLALAIQVVTEEIVLKMACEAKRLTGSEYLVMAGGVALNCVANGRLLREKIFKGIYIQPAAGDAGGALGAALATAHLYFDEERTLGATSQQNAGTYLGPEFSNMDVIRMSRKAKAVYSEHGFDELSKLAASKLADGQVVGWFQGRMEFGPRALGNRSILGDARNPEMQQKINVKIKFREGFRPFAPAVLGADAKVYFELEAASPAMLFVAPVKTERRKALPENMEHLDFKEKLAIERSDVPAITHVDFSARVQTVEQTDNARFWQLINDFKQQTGCSLVINTSFNQRGEPMVCTPLDAYRTFMATDMDFLVINDFLYCKTEQPNWQDKSRWTINFAPD